LDRKKKIIVTGGAGFVAHHFVEHIIKNTDWDVIIIDKLGLSSMGYDRLRDIDVYDDKRVHIVNHDFRSPATEGVIRECRGTDYFIHMAAETHVDRSIENPVPFIDANVYGTHNALFMAKDLAVKRFMYFSTDEVFGPAKWPKEYQEWERYKSGNPYAATKAGGEELALAYANTYKSPVIITHTMNVFGERQYPEKFIPMCIRKIRDGEKIIIHSSRDKTKIASRYWIHARNVAGVTLFILNNGHVGDKYNIVGETEMNALEMAQHIAAIMDKPFEYELSDYHSSRPGHDMRYALNGEKVLRMGYVYPKTFMQSLEKTVQWMLDNPKWLEI